MQATSAREGKFAVTITSKKRVVAVGKFATERQHSVYSTTNRSCPMMTEKLLTEALKRAGVPAELHGHFRAYWNAVSNAAAEIDEESNTPAAEETT